MSNVEAHKAAIEEAEHTVLMLREAANATTPITAALAVRLRQAATVIEHLLPLHRTLLQTSQFNATASEGLQKTVDYKNKTT